MKKYIYKLTLESGHEFDYTIDVGIMFNSTNEAGEKQEILITSAILSECVDVDNVSENEEIVIEAEDAS
jgi:hypothetical protein